MSWSRATLALSPRVQDLQKLLVSSALGLTIVRESAKTTHVFSNAYQSLFLCQLSLMVSPPPHERLIFLDAYA